MKVHLLVLFLIALLGSSFATAPTYVFIGHTGSGKSTVINLLLGTSTSNKFKLHETSTLRIADSENFELYSGTERQTTGSPKEVLLKTMEGMEMLGGLNGVVIFFGAYSRIHEGLILPLKAFAAAVESVGIPIILLFNQCSEFSCKRAKYNYELNRGSWNAWLGEHQAIFMERRADTDPAAPFDVNHLDREKILSFFINHGNANPATPFKLHLNWKEELTSIS